MSSPAGRSEEGSLPGAHIPLFVMRGVTKRYGVRALQDAELVIEAGRIHAVLGENGAGKSTLIKIMAGVVAPDEGSMLLDGRAGLVRRRRPPPTRPASSASSRSCR